MIPILFEANATDFTTFGIGALKDTTSCEVTEERNGAYELVLKYPTNGSLYSYIQKECIIVAKPNDTSNNQAFRIYRITVPIGGIITVYAQHISYDLATVGVMPFDISNASPNYAMEQVFLHSAIPTNFSFQSEYSTVKQFTVTEPVSIRSLIGGSSGSILDKWGGEFEWDNFVVKHRQHRGQDNGIVVAYGKNLTKLDHDTDCTDIYTHILPYAIATSDDGEETVVTLPECVIAISSILTNGKTCIKDFTDQFGTDERVTEYALRTKANVWINEHPMGVETPSITVSFEPLWNQSEYAAIYERISLCDTVTVKHTLLNVNEKMKVTKVIYDTLAEKYLSMVLGEVKSNMAVKMNELESKVTQEEKEIDRFPILMNAAISNATKLITGNKGGTVVLHSSSEDGKPYELLIMDDEDITEATNVWRWNLGGLGFSSHGYNGPYETAITNDGAIVADFITSGTLIANIIKAGILQSRDGSSYWNIDTGEIVLNAYATTEEVEEQAERIDEIEDQKMYRLIIYSSNGNIFKNGQISTVLTARVYSWDDDVTDDLDANQFIWTRVSDDADEDILWNQAHAGGTKSITITSADVHVRATFYCDLIDTTTRESLL